MLQTRARIKKSEMAWELEISVATLQERIRRLEESDVIKDYQAIIDPEKMVDQYRLSSPLLLIGMNPLIFGLLKRYRVGPFLKLKTTTHQLLKGTLNN